MARDTSGTSLTYDINTAYTADLEPLTVKKEISAPHRYAYLLLDEKLAPFNVWNRLYGAMRSEGVLRFCTPLINYLILQLLGNLPLNSALVDEDELVQHQTDARFLHNRLSVLQHMEPSSATAPPPSSPFSTQVMSVVELTEIIKAIYDGHTTPATSSSS